MALATRGTIDPVRKFLSRASYSENLGGFRAALFSGTGTVIAAPCQRGAAGVRMTCLLLGILPPASAGVGGSQKGNLRPSVSIHDVSSTVQGCRPARPG